MYTINKFAKFALFFMFLLINTTAFAYMHPAELRIENNSQRQLTVKVMTSAGNKYTTVNVGSHSTKTINIHQTGNYYLKTKAVYPGKMKIYKKGNPFQVYVGSDGYSILTITFSLQESALPDPMSGQQISASEFEKDSD